MGNKDECKHRRIKRNFPFGRKSRPVISCKDCGIPLKKYDLKKKKRVRK